MTWQEKIERLLRDRGETRADLAGALGMPAATLQKWWQRGSQPSYEVLLAVAVRHAVSVDWLIDPAGAWPFAPTVARGDDTARLVGLLRRALDAYDSATAELTAAAAARVAAAAKAQPPGRRPVARGRRRPAG